MIKREISDIVKEMAGYYPVVTVMGPRQSGKTTLVKALFPKHAYFNLESSHVRDSALADPMAFIASAPSGMILDEIQKAPQLLEFIQVMVDNNSGNGRFIITGSHQPELAQAISESLAGRTGIAELLPLSANELASAGFNTSKRNDMIFTGSMPRIYNSNIPPTRFYADYFRTYIERDVRKILNVTDIDRFELFIKLLAGRVGQLINRQALAADVGVSDKTIANWISVLRASYIIFPLKPYYRNFGKRQTKAPKIYFFETGLVSYLLGIRTSEMVATHPLVGNLFENLVVSEEIKHRFNKGKESDVYFYRNSSGSIEIDMIVEDDGKIHPLEIKSSSTFSDSMCKGLKTFANICPEAERGRVIYSGETMPIAANFADTSVWCI